MQVEVVNDEREWAQMVKELSLSEMPADPNDPSDPNQSDSDDSLDLNTLSEEYQRAHEDPSTRRVRFEEEPVVQEEEDGGGDSDGSEYTDDSEEDAFDPHEFDPVKATATGLIRYRKFKRRWRILMVFGLLNWINAVTWITFASVSTSTADYYDVKKSAVNWLVLIFSIMYIPGTPFASWVYLKWGLRVGMITGGCFTCVGAWVRMISVRGIANEDQAQDNGFVFLVVGQIIASVGQPFFTNAAARIAGDWFPHRERSIATTLGALFNPLGIATAQVLPPLFVDRRHPSGTVTGIPSLHLAVGIISTSAVVLAVLWFEDSPPVPPSKSSAHKAHILSEQLQRGGNWDELQLPKHRYSRALWDEIVKLLTNKHYLILLTTFGLGLAMFNALLTLIEQLTKPFGYSDDAAGTFGGLIIVFGLTGATLSSFVTDKYHNYNLALKVAFTTTILTATFTAFSMRPDGEVQLGASFALLGLTTVPALPIAFQCAAECTFPINEDLSSGILNMAGNLLGLISVPVTTLLIEDAECRSVGVGPEKREVCDFDGTKTFEEGNPSLIFLVAWICLVALCSLFYNGPYLRTSRDEEPDQVTPLSEGELARLDTLW